MPKIVAPTSSGKKVNELIIKNKVSAEDAIKQVLGEINAVIPEGAQIINQSLNYIEYKDKEGYVHKITRNGDATSPDFGRLNEQTDRPAVLPATQQIPGLSDTLKQAMDAVRGGLGGHLSQLTPQDQAQLEAISNAVQQQLTQQFTRQGGELVTQLYGRGTQQSTLAGQAVADLLQSQGLVQSQALSEAAQRQLGLQQFLTQLSTGTGADILKAITGQETERGIASGQLGLGQRDLDQRAAEAARNYLLEFQKFQATQRKSILNRILAGVGSLAAGGGGLGALGGLLGIGGNKPSGSGGYSYGGTYIGE